MALGAVSVPVVVASVAWACGPSGYGVPETPGAPPASTAVPPAASTAAPTTGTTAAPTQAPSTPAQSGSNVTKGVNQNSGSKAAPKPVQRVSKGGTTAPSTAGQADLTARIGGSTAGVTEQRGQTVFKSSTAPRSAKAAKPNATRSPSAAAPAVSERSATADLWSGVTSANTSSLAAAEAIDGSGGGLSGGAIALIAGLGLGLAGIAGFALATAGRRRAVAGASKK